MKKTLIRLTLPVILAVLLVSLARSDALAKPPVPEDPQDPSAMTNEQIEALFTQLEASMGLFGAATDAQASTLLGSGGSATAGGVTASLKVNPWGCIGQTDNPHRSTTRRVLAVNVHGRTECPGGQKMPEMTVLTRLYRATNCVGSICFGWTPWGPIGEKSRTDVSVVEATSAGPCVNGRYKGLSVHWMRGKDNKTYSGVTSKSNVVTNCP